MGMGDQRKRWVSWGLRVVEVGVRIEGGGGRGNQAGNPQGQAQPPARSKPQSLNTPQTNARCKSGFEIITIMINRKSEWMQKGGKGRGGSARPLPWDTKGGRAHGKIEISCDS